MHLDVMAYRPPTRTTGVTLHNLQLRVEALDYLQLPVTIKEGHIGCLSLQARGMGGGMLVTLIHEVHKPPGATACTVQAAHCGIHPGPRAACWSTA